MHVQLADSSRPRRAVPAARFVAILLALSAAACGGGGGGGGPGAASATLLFAVFEGSSAADSTPSPGELLTLYFTGDIALVSGAALDDGDVVFSSPTATLGTAPGAPQFLDARAVRITLGTGVSFRPGTDKVRLAAGQDVVQDGGGRLLGASLDLTLATSDGGRPTVGSLTLDGIPDVLNGSGPAGGTLQVPERGFTIDATFADTTFSGPGTINPALFQLASTRSVRVNSVDLPAGSNLFLFLTGSPGPTSFSMTVPSSVEFLAGDQVLSLAAVDSTFNVSTPKTISIRVKPLDDNIRPLENGQTWYVDLGRDVDAITSSPGAGGIIDLTVTDGANGASDFLEELLVLGLRSPAPIANVIGTKDSNEVVLDLLRARILSRLGEIYGGTGVTFTFTDPGSFPSGRAFVPYNATSHSRIELGAETWPKSQALGIALFDPNNKNQDDDTLVPGTYSGVVVDTRLGVFPHTMTAAAINMVGGKFRQVLDPFIDHRGTPVGEDTMDGSRLVNITNSVSGDTRQARMQTAIDEVGGFLAVLLGHECGHSLGLVKDGAMPAGLYGGDATNFPGSTTGHISLANTGIFPAGAIEVMSPAISFETATHPSTAFNPLIVAYLRERALYDN